MDGNKKPCASSQGFLAFSLFALSHNPISTDAPPD